jgi:predicted DCC family thiol-disulfide oxidoreductase YuxK
VNVNKPVCVASPPSKPLMIFDGDCHFCAIWVQRWQKKTGEGVEYIPYQDPRIPELFPELSRERLPTAVHFITTDGLVYTGAEAAIRALAVNPRRQMLLNFYRKSAVFAAISERVYRFVAEHRSFYSRLTRIN